MDRETRLAWLLDHYRRPRHVGALPDADVRIPGGNPGCGDIITLYLKAEPGADRIDAVSWEGVGCTLSQAAASILVERMNTKKPNFAEILAMPPEEMIDLLGRDIAESRPGCALLALGTLKGAVKTVEMDRLLKAAGHSDAQIRELRKAIAEQGEASGVVVGDGAEHAARSRVLADS
ncbi:MAG TPA: iron-sulfur cluster assembly scaffold protein [Gemmatimonadales bacterium]|nr:iron-sulfur cluster assembly scaffold protein [Gemmatimonadales bacterium]